MAVNGRIGQKQKQLTMTQKEKIVQCGKSSHDWHKKFHDTKKGWCGT